MVAGKHLSTHRQRLLVQLPGAGQAHPTRPNIDAHPVEQRPEGGSGQLLLVSVLHQGIAMGQQPCAHRPGRGLVWLLGEQGGQQPNRSVNQLVSVVVG